MKIYLLLAGSDFNPTQGSVKFTQQSRVCYRQRIIDDKEPEKTESFRVSIESDPNILIGDPSSTLIEINDDDEGLYMFLSVNLHIG